MQCFREQWSTDPLPNGGGGGGLMKEMVKAYAYVKYNSIVKKSIILKRNL